MKKVILCVLCAFASQVYAQNTDEVTKLRNDVKTLQSGHASHEKLRNAHQTCLDSLKEVVAKLQAQEQKDNAELKSEEYQLGNEQTALNKEKEYTQSKFMRYHSIIKRSFIIELLAFVFLAIACMIIYIIIRNNREQTERNFTMNTIALQKMESDFDKKIAESDEVTDAQIKELNKLLLSESRDIKSAYITLVDTTKMKLTTSIAESYIKAISQCTEMDKTTSKHLTLLKEDTAALHDEFNLWNKKITALEKSNQK